MGKLCMGDMGEPPCAHQRCRNRQPVLTSTQIARGLTGSLQTLAFANRRASFQTAPAPRLARTQALRALSDRQGAAAKVCPRGPARQRPWSSLKTPICLDPEHWRAERRSASAHRRAIRRSGLVTVRNQSRAKLGGSSACIRTTCAAATSLVSAQQRLEQELSETVLCCRVLRREGLL